VPQIHVRIPLNVHAVLTALVRERKLKGGLSELCGTLISNIVLDGFEFSQLDAISKKLDRLTELIANLETRSSERNLKADLSEHVLIQTAALSKIVKLLESSEGKLK
jgi:hypothetical protein